METPLDRLVMADMIRIGLLRPKEHEVLVEHPSGLKMLLWSRDDPDAIKAAWIEAGNAVNVIIEITWELVGELLRPYFVCSETGKLCNVVFLYRGRFVHRSAPLVDDTFRYWRQSLLGDEWLDKHRARVLGEDGRGPARGNKRKKLLELLAKQPDYLKLYPELALEIRRAERAEHRVPGVKRRANLSIGAMSTSCGFEEQAWADSKAAQLFKKETYQKSASMQGYNWDRMGAGVRTAVERGGAKAQAEYIEWLRKMAKTFATFAKRPKFDIESVPTLDVQTIVSRIDPVSTQPNSFGLAWQVQDQRLEFSGLYAPMGAASHWLYIQRDGHAGPNHRQVIEVTRTAKGQRMIVCPINGLASKRLYYRDGIFASAKAQQLIHNSQRKNTREPPLRIQRKIVLKFLK